MHWKFSFHTITPLISIGKKMVLYASLEELPRSVRVRLNLLVICTDVPSLAVLFVAILILCDRRVPDRAEPSNWINLKSSKAF